MNNSDLLQVLQTLATLYGHVSKDSALAGKTSVKISEALSKLDLKKSLYNDNLNTGYNPPASITYTTDNLTIAGTSSATNTNY